LFIRCRAPLRLGFAGGGTDVSPFCDRFGGAVLNAAIDLYAHCTVEESEDGKVRFCASDGQLEEEHSRAANLPTNNRLALHAAVYNRMITSYNDGQALPVKVTTFCDAPAGSGLGSSSTLVVAMVTAFSEYLHLALGEYEIARLAHQIERCDAGLQGGKQDQYAAAFGGFNFMEFGAADSVLVNPLRIKESTVAELESSLVLYYTGRSRESAAIIAEQSRHVVQGDCEAIEAMHKTKEEALHMKECLLRGDIRGFAAVMGRAWVAKKRMAHSISNERIDHLYEVAMEAGAYSGKVSGAGGGGFMMFLVDPKDRLKVIRALTGQPDSVVFNCHFTHRGAEAWRV